MSLETFNKELFKGTVAVVTGGTSGLGNATSIRLASLGAKVFAVGLNSKETNIPEGLSIEPIELDVTDNEKVKEFMTGLNRLDLLFNAAGIIGKNERDLDTFEKVVKIHLTASFYFSELARPLLKESDIGSIVNVSSMAAIFGSPESVAYSSAKGAIDQLTKSNAIEFAKDNIRVNAVAPGFIKTPIFGDVKGNEDFLNPMKERTPQKRFGEPEELANVVTFLFTPAASHLNGVVIPVDGGFSVNM